MNYQKCGTRVAVLSAIIAGLSAIIAGFSAIYQARYTARALSVAYKQLAVSEKNLGLAETQTKVAEKNLGFAEAQTKVAEKNLAIASEQLNVAIDGLVNVKRQIDMEFLKYQINIINTNLASLMQIYPKIFNMQSGLQYFELTKQEFCSHLGWLDSAEKQTTMRMLDDYLNYYKMLMPNVNLLSDNPKFNKAMGVYSTNISKLTWPDPTVTWDVAKIAKFKKETMISDINDMQQIIQENIKAELEKKKVLENRLQSLFPKENNSDARK